MALDAAHAVAPAAPPKSRWRALWAPIALKIWWLGLSWPVLWRARRWTADQLGRRWHWFTIDGHPEAAGLVLAVALLSFNPWHRYTVFVIFVLLLLVWYAHQHIVIDEVADRTRGPSLTNGAATLLTVELARIYDVFKIVDERNALPTAVGEQRPVHAAVKVDDVTEVLQSSVSAEAKVSVGPIVIPLGPAMALLAKIVQGPRLRSELHETEDGLVLTAQLSGFQRTGTWRIERTIERATRADRLRTLHEMIEELACRMFTNLGVERKVKWRAMKHFVTALRTFRSCLRTPRDRGFNLAQAEASLRQALAEDEDFVLVYYNLGVVYSELRRLARDAHDEAEAARCGRSAEAAFKCAIEQDPARWSAYYALARMQFGDDETTLEGPARETARELCERVIAMPRSSTPKAERAKAHDLISFTYPAGSCEQLRHRQRACVSALDALLEGLRHRRSPGAEDDAVPALEDLAANCLVNLACAEDAYLESEVRSHRQGSRAGRRRIRALFDLAERLTAKEARLHFQLGDLAEGWGDCDLAAEEYREAARIEPGRALYWARLARAHLARGTEQATRAAETACDRARRSGDFLYGQPKEDGEAAEILGEVYRKLAKLAKTTSTAKRKKYLLDSRRFSGMAEFRADFEALRKAEPGVEELAEKINDYVRKDQLWEAAHVAVFAGKQLQGKDQLMAAWCFNSAREWFGEDYETEVARRGASGRSALALAREYGNSAPTTLRLETALGEALLEAEQAVSVDPMSGYDREVLADVYASLQDLERARSTWTEALLWTPNDPELHWKLGFVYWRLAMEATDASTRRRRLKHAHDMLARALKLYGNEAYPARCRVHYWIAKVAAERCEFERVVPHVRIVQGSPGLRTPLADFLLAGAYFRTRRFDEAERLYRRVLDETTCEDVKIGTEVGDATSQRVLRVRAACGLANSLTERYGRLGDAEKALRQASQCLARIKKDGAEEAIALEAALLAARGRVQWRKSRKGAEVTLKKSLELIADAEVYVDLVRINLARALAAGKGARAPLLIAAHDYCELARDTDVRGLCTDLLEKLAAKLEAAEAA
jgi:Tfp pilus assembly protein PilF